MPTETEQLEQLKKSLRKFVDDFYRMEDNGLVLATVKEEDKKRHEFEWKLLKPWISQTVTYLAQWLPPGERCNHIHNAHGISRCTSRVVVPGKSRYCDRHAGHRDNYPTPRVSQAEVDRITREEVDSMRGEVYADWV